MISGITDSYDSGVAVVDDEGKAIFSVTEEMLVRDKLDTGWPKKSIELWNPTNPLVDHYRKWLLERRYHQMIRIYSKIYKVLLKKKFGKKIRYVDHHMAHAASAYYTSGFKKALILTSDRSGNGCSLTINIGKDGCSSHADYTFNQSMEILEKKSVCISKQIRNCAHTADQECNRIYWYKKQNEWYLKIKKIKLIPTPIGFTKIVVCSK